MCAAGQVDEDRLKEVQSYAGMTGAEIRSTTLESIEFAHFKSMIVAQANASGSAGWVEISVPSCVRKEGFLRIPRGALEMWAVARHGGGHLAAPWIPISPAGLKTPGDDRFHSDVLIGSGVGLRDVVPHYGYLYWRDLDEALHAARADIQRRLIRFGCEILLSGPPVTGKVWAPKRPDERLPLDWQTQWQETRAPIAILPHAGAEYLEAALIALGLGGAVIVESGGAMAHLVTVLRGEGKGPIVRDSRASQKYPPNAVLVVYPRTGSIEFAPQAYSVFANCPDPFGDGRRYARVPEDDAPTWIVATPKVSVEA